MNGFHILILAFVFVGGVILIPRAIRHDIYLRNIEAMDDEELAAALAEFPDLLDRRAW